MTDRTDPPGRDRESAAGAGSSDDGVIDAVSGGERRPSQPDTDDGSGIQRYFSPRAFLIVFVLLAALGHAGATFVPVVGGLIGIFAGAFAVGLASERRRYGETATAGGVLGGVGVVLENVSLAILTGSFVPLVAIGALLGAVVAAAGAYFGRDLRDGVMREV